MGYKIGFWNGIHRAQKWRDENPKASARLDVDVEAVERDNQSINQSNPHKAQSRTRAQSHTRARRSPSQRHLKGSKPRVAKRRRLGGLKAPTLTEARVEAVNCGAEGECVVNAAGDSRPQKCALSAVVFVRCDAEGACGKCGRRLKAPGYAHLAP